MKFPASPMKILIVDDDELARLALSGLWQQQGYSCETAMDGEEAVEKVQAACFDLVCMDGQMPRLEGWSATEKIRQILGSTAPVVVGVSSLTTADSQEKCLSSGMSAFYAKPFEAAKLQELIELVPYPLDRAKLQSQFLGMQAVLAKIIQEFLLRGPQSALHLQELSAENPQDPALARAAHTLKGTLSYFYAGPTLDLARRVQDGETHPHSLRKLVSEVSRLCEVLKNIQLDV